MKRIYRAGMIAAGSLLLAGCSLLATPTPIPLVLPTATLPVPSATATPLLLPPIPTAITPLGPTALPTAILLPTFTSVVPVHPTLASAPAGGPVIQPGSPTGPYGVILVASNDVLNIRSGPGISYTITGSFGPAANNLMRTGPSSITSDGALWVEVQAPGGGAGWVNSFYMAEYVTPGTFCADSRVTTLINSLKMAFTNEDGALLASLVSPGHGMTVQYNRGGTRVTYDSEHARWVFDSTYQVNWGPAPGSGLDTLGSFQQIVTPKLQDVLSASFTTGCNQIMLGGASYTVTWPPELSNIPYQSLYKPGSETYGGLDWQTWLMGVEYVGGVPYIFSLSYYAWEP